MENQPIVSIIAICYNQARFVVECLESIRLQTYQNVQLIIMDDCSSDDSVDVIQDWIKQHEVSCVFIPHKKNVGICKTLNEALSHATGKYMSMLAADDIYELEKTEEQVKLMETLPESVGVVYSDSWQITEDGDLLPLKFIEAHRKFDEMPEGDIFETVLTKNFIPAMATLIRRECFEKVGLYDERLCYEDLDMWLRIARKYNYVFSPYISAKYRIVSTSLARTVLHVPSWAQLSSNFLIHEKCLSARIDKSRRRSITDDLHDLAERMYKHNYDGRNYYLFRSSLHHARPHSLGMLLFSVAGVSYKEFSKFVSWFGSIRQRASKSEPESNSS